MNACWQLGTSEDMQVIVEMAVVSVEMTLKVFLLETATVGTGMATVAVEKALVFVESEEVFQVIALSFGETA